MKQTVCTSMVLTDSADTGWASAIGLDVIPELACATDPNGDAVEGRCKRLKIRGITLVHRPG